MQEIEIERDILPQEAESDYDDRCPNCGSFKIQVKWFRDDGGGAYFESTCRVCGFVESSQ